MAHSIEFKLEGFYIGDGYMTTREIGISVEADIELDEFWYRDGKPYYEPYVEDVRFNVQLGIDSDEANTAYSTWLHGQWATKDKDFRKQINSYALSTYEELIESDNVEAKRAAGGE